MPVTENKVFFGLAEVHIAMMQADGTYDTPIAIPGAVKLTTDPQGDSEKFYADDGVYYTAVLNNGYTGELEMALLTDDIKAKIFNWDIDDNGAIVEDAEALPSKFALMFRVRGDQRKRYNVYYNVTAERPKSEHSTTQDKATPGTETLSVSMIPTSIDGRKVTKLSIEPTEQNASVTADFFGAVYTPTFTSASQQAPSYPNGTPSDSWTKAQLLAYCADNSITSVGESNTKEEILAAIASASA